MGFEGVGRRAYLSGLSGAFVGAAGCSDQVLESGTDEQQTPSHGSPTTDEETVSPTSEDEEQPLTYRIFKANGEVRAENSQSESVEFSDTDATDVIQQAAYDNDADTIFLTPGEYLIGSQEIQLPSETHLRGAGRTATTLKLRDGINGRR